MPTALITVCLGLCKHIGLVGQSQDITLWKKSSVSLAL